MKDIFRSLLLVVLPCTYKDLLHPQWIRICKRVLYRLKLEQTIIVRSSYLVCVAFFLTPVYARPQVPLDTTWTEQSSGITSTLTGVSAVSQNVAWVCATSGAVLRTTNGGATWLGAGMLTGAGSAIAGLDSTTAIVASDPAAGLAKIWKTTNGGGSWSARDSTSDYVYRIQMVTRNIGFCFALRAGVFFVRKTTNEGETWSDSIFQAAGIWPMFWLDASSGWLGFDNGTQHGVYRTTDGGVSWNFQPTSFSLGPFSCLHFTSASIGLVGGIGSIMYRTSNNGMSWVGSPYIWVPQMYSMTSLHSSPEFWAVAGTSVWYTSDFGDSWANTAPNGYPGRQLFPLERISLVEENNTAHAWAVGFGGSIVHYSRVITSVKEDDGIISRFSLSHNFPNPFNPVTTIAFAIAQPSFVTIRVFDLLGREVTTIVKEEMGSGKYERKLDGGGLSSGIYFYRLQAGSFIETKKLILLK